MVSKAELLDVRKIKASIEISRAGQKGHSEK